MKSQKLILSIICLSLFCTFMIFPQTKKDGIKLYEEGNYTEAIPLLQAEINKTPNNMDLYTFLCWSLLEKKQYREVDYWATQALKLSPYDHRIIEILAEAKYFLGDNQQALKLFQNYISLISSSGAKLGSAYYFIGEIYIRLAKFNHADIAFSQATHISPLQIDYWIKLGYAREMTKNYRGSAIAYETALKLNKNNEDAIQGKKRVMVYIN